MMAVTGTYLARWLVFGIGIAWLGLPAAAESEFVAQPAADFLAPGSQLTSEDCSRARDASRCLAMPKAREICQGKRGVARRLCVKANMPAPDCAQAPDPRLCQARQQARLACQGRPGKELRKCLRQAVAATPPPISSIN